MNPSFETYRFKLHLTGKENNRVIERKTIENRTVNFKFPVTAIKRPKIYLIKVGNEVVYVGYTSQSHTSRLNYGMKANGETGYYGYHWKDKGDVFGLLVFVFDLEFDDDEKLNKKKKHFVEAIEAELVLAFRNETGFCPKYQNEIHFNNGWRDEVLGVVGEIKRMI